MKEFEKNKSEEKEVYADIKSIENDVDCLKQYNLIPEEETSNPTLTISAILPLDFYSNISVSQIGKHIEKYHEETLFYIFYNFPETSVQIDCFKRLTELGYMFSETLNLFVFIIGNIEIDNKIREVVVFDPVKWERCSIKINFDRLFLLSLRGKNDV